MSGVEPRSTIRADSVTEIGLRVIAYIDFKRVPIAGTVTNLLARGANGQKTAQRLDFGQGFLQFVNQLLLLVFSGLSLAYVPEDQACSAAPTRVVENNGRHFYGKGSPVLAASIQFSGSPPGLLPLGEHQWEARVCSVH